MYFKTSIGILLALILAGCANSHKTAFSKEEDSLNKSPCSSCYLKKPFYVNGRWV